MEDKLEISEHADFNRMQQVVTAKIDSGILRNMIPHDIITLVIDELAGQIIKEKGAEILASINPKVISEGISQSIAEKLSEKVSKALEDIKV